MNDGPLACVTYLDQFVGPDALELAFGILSIMLVITGRFSDLKV